MKESHRIDLQILELDGEEDERKDNVFLLSVDGEEDKTTAEDCGEFWQIRDWEVTNGPKCQKWFCRFAYSIDKKTVLKLSAITKPEALTEDMK